MLLIFSKVINFIKWLMYLKNNKQAYNILLLRLIPHDSQLWMSKSWNVVKFNNLYSFSCHIKKCDYFMIGLRHIHIEMYQYLLLSIGSNGLEMVKVNCYHLFIHCISYLPSVFCLVTDIYSLIPYRKYWITINSLALFLCNRLNKIERN